MTDPAVAVAVDLARRLPISDISRLAAALAEGPGHLSALQGSAAGPTLREACSLLCSLPDIDPSWLAGALTGAAAAFADADQAEQLDVVWTGPHSDVDTGRLTAPAVVELIDQAQRELLVVSYATHHEPRIADALGAAADRGVDIALLLERHADNSSYTATADAFAGLRARRLTWSADRRPLGAALHAKLIVVDRTVALVGSANLTGRAMVHNLECGILIRGGTQPGAISDHVWSLVRRGELRIS